MKKKKKLIAFLTCGCLAFTLFSHCLIFLMVLQSIITIVQIKKVLQMLAQ